MIRDPPGFLCLPYPRSRSLSGSEEISELLALALAFAFASRLLSTSGVEVYQGGGGGVGPKVLCARVEFLRLGPGLLVLDVRRRKPVKASSVVGDTALEKDSASSLGVLGLGRAAALVSICMLFRLRGPGAAWPSRA